MTNPFDWEYLTRVPRGLEAYGPLALAFVAVFGLGLLVSVVLARVLERRFRDHALHRRLAARGTQVATWLFGVGLAFFALRALELPILGMRLWLYLSALALLVAGGLAVWYRLARYPAARRRYEQEQARQHYLQPAPATRKRRRRTAANRS